MALFPVKWGIVEGQLFGVLERGQGKNRLAARQKARRLQHRAMEKPVRRSI